MPLRDDLLQTSTALIAAGGLDALSIRAVAGRCGVSIGAVQHHFSTKSHLLMAVVEATGDELRGVLPASDSGELTDAEATQALVGVAELLGGAVDEAPGPIKVWLAFLAHGLADEKVAHHHRKLWRSVESALSDLLSRVGADSGECPDRAALLVASLDGIALARAMEPERMPLERSRRLVHRAVAVALN